MRLALAAALLLFALPAAAQPGPAPDNVTPPHSHAPATPAMMAARHAAHEACAADMTRLCPDAAAGSHPMQCLRQHMSDVSAPCAQALQAMREARRAGETQG